MKAVVAMSENRVIGRDGTLPWHLPGDLKFFKETTTGHRIVMGRKTFDSIGRALPKRETIVLTHNRSFKAPLGVIVLHNPEEVLALPPSERQTYIVGGAGIYRIFLPWCEGVYLTTVKRSAEGDTFLPPFEEEFLLEREIEDQPEYRIDYYRRRC